MSSPNEARRTSAQIFFKGVDISEDMRPYFLSATYTESEEDEADDLQIKLQDRNAIWLEHWLEDMIEAAASKSDKEETAATPPAASPATGSGTLATYRVTARSGLNVRSGPSTAYSIIGGLVSGATVQVYSVENNWAKIEYGGQAYACASYLAKISDGSPPSGGGSGDSVSSAGDIFIEEDVGGSGASPSASGSSASLSVYKVTARSGLNVRSGPGTNYGRIGGLTNGAEIQVQSIDGGWAKIDYNGSTAYASASYLQKVKDGSGSAAEKTGAKAETDTKLKLRAIFVRENWSGGGKDTLLDCGYFSLDSVKISGPPSVITLKAAAVSYKARIRQTEKSHVWEEFPLSGIAKDIASENGMTLLFLSSNDPYYTRVEQFKTCDIKFLSGLCHDAGIAVKVTSNLLILYEQAEFEKKDSVLTVSRGDGSYTKWDLSAGQASEEYDSCRVSYTDPATGRCISAVARVEDSDPEAEENRQLEITAKVSSEAEALTLAEKSLRLHNKFSKTVSLTFPGNPNLMSGLTMELKRWGAFNGKYAIKKTVHTIGNSGYTTKVELRKILEG